MKPLSNFINSLTLGMFDVGVKSLKSMISGRAYAGRTHGLSDLLLYAKLVDDGILLQTDRSYLTAFWYRGNDLETSTDEELTVLSEQLNSAFMTLGSGWMFQVDIIRHQSNNYTPESESHFGNLLAELIDNEQRTLYESENGHYENGYVISFTYKPKIDVGSKMGVFFRKNESTKVIYDSSYYLQEFKSRVGEIVSYLSHSLEIEQMDSTQLLSFIEWTITNENTTLQLPIKANMFIKHYLASRDLTVGENLRVGSDYIKAVTITGFPAEAYPSIVDRLNYMNFEYRWSTRFIILDNYEANNIIDKISNLWYQKRIGAMDTVKQSLSIDSNIKVNQNAENQYNESEYAKSINDSGDAKFGYYTSTIIISSSDENEAQRNAETIRSELRQIGFQSYIETHHALEAWLSSIAGQSFPNIRKWLIHTQNVADIIPNTAIWSGLSYNPCKYYQDNNPPLFFARTTGYTPLRLSLHTGENGNTLILGSSLYDKATLMNFIIAQHFRYKNARVFVFDKNKATLPLCYGCDGAFYDIGGNDNDIYFQPLAHLENDLDFDFAATWIEELCILNDMPIKFNDSHRKAIRHALRLLKDAPVKRRTLSYFRHLVNDFDRAVSDLLDTICSEDRAPSDTIKTNGFRSKIFDSDIDFMSTSQSKFNVFEMSKLMEVGDGVALPALRYLIHAVGKQIYSGEPTLIVFNESTILFQNPILREKLIEWVKSLVPYNVAVIFTADINDLSKYPELKKDLKSICATQFFSSNSKAMTADEFPLYKEMMLNKKQIEMISGATSGQYLYVSELGIRMFSLDINPASATYAFTSNIEPRKINKAIELNKGRGNDKFAKLWLKECNVGEWQLNKLDEHKSDWR